MADRGALRRRIHLHGGGCGCLRGLWDRRFHLNARRRPREPLSPRSLLPAASSATSSHDVRRRCCATDVGPRRQDRRGTPVGVASRSSGVRDRSRVRVGRPRHLAAERPDSRNRCESLETSSSVIESSEHLRAHRKSTDRCGIRRRTAKTARTCERVDQAGGVTLSRLNGASNGEERPTSPAPSHARGTARMSDVVRER